MKFIESNQNALVKYWKKLATTRKERDKSGEFLVEGFHLVEEALKHTDVLHLIIREGVEIPSDWDIDNVFLIEVTDAIAKELAETEHTQGIFAQCKQKQFDASQQSSWTKLLLVDAVQDPGNIGTMIRTADAAGIDAVVLGKGSADPYNPKTVRSTQGSIFHIPVVRGDLNDWVADLKDNGVPVYGTALENSVVYNEVEKEGKFALIMGNEGSGIAPELLKQTDANVIIPIKGAAESLNVAVATGIVLYHFAL
jgi:RNA methyltransferase, TrmH family